MLVWLGAVVSSIWAGPLVLLSTVRTGELPLSAAKERILQAPTMAMAYTTVNPRWRRNAERR